MSLLGGVPAARSLAKRSLHDIYGDFAGGVTSDVVALPMTLAFGVASGSGPIARIHWRVERLRVRHPLSDSTQFRTPGVPRRFADLCQRPVHD